jgi:hypothetical protein
MNLGDRARQAAKELRAATEDLNARLRGLEDAMFENGTPKATTKLSSGRLLIWDGRHLYIQVGTGNRQLLTQCSRSLRVEACHSLRELVQ